MALQGTLQDFSLADIFQLIGIQKKTGVLTLKNNAETVTVAFADGAVVGADSTVRRLEDRLGTVLVKSGRLSEAQLQDALRQQRSTHKRLGTILVEGQFLDAAGLSEALQVQISQLVYRLFRWTSGSYQFNQEAKVDDDRELISPMSAESILMEGARILDEWPMVEKGIHSLNAVWRHANVEIARTGGATAAADDEAAGAVTLNDTERLVYGLVDGKRPVQEIVDRSALSEFETCRTLYELISRQLLEEVRVAPARAAAPSAAAPHPAPARVRTGQGAPILLGFATLLLVLAAGGAFLYRLLPEIPRYVAGEGLVVTLEPFLGRADEQRVMTALSRSRLQRVDGAIHVYYLLNRGFPADLSLLVNEGFLGLSALRDTAGQPFAYKVTQDGFSLATTEGVTP
ncbi:MAG TPA: DUF4388 domain-containing protein [Candidatus Polarisedimenticolia bacterium]|nr:DUF4388 domain-containing protein [Candidatus Polarisedimenticolia bacterium]